MKKIALYMDVSTVFSLDQQLYLYANRNASGMGMPAENTIRYKITFEIPDPLGTDVTEIAAETEEVVERLSP